MARGRRQIDTADEEEVQSLMWEAAGPIDPPSTRTSTAGSEDGRTGSIKEKSSGARIWQVLTLILVGIVVLFATDSIELKLGNKGGAVDGKKTPFAANVQQKEEPAVDASSDGNTNVSPDNAQPVKPKTGGGTTAKYQNVEAVEKDKEEAVKKIGAIKEELKAAEEEEEKLEMIIEAIRPTQDELATMEYAEEEIEKKIEVIEDELEVAEEEEEDLEMKIEASNHTGEEFEEAEKEKEEMEKKIEAIEEKLEVAEEEEEELEMIIKEIKPTEQKLEEAEEEEEELETKIEAIEEKLEEAEEEEEKLEKIIEAINPTGEQLADAETTDSENTVSSETKEDSETTEGSESEAETETTDSTYSRRGQPMNEKDQEEMIKQWGSWTVVDEKERPTEDFYKKYPTRDIPRSEFPSNAWQIDKDYLAKFLPESIALAQRAQEAILAEYGQPMNGDWDNRTEMFRIEQFDTLEGQAGLSKGKRGKGGHECLSRGGWTTKKSWEGLKKRLLHAVMTEDSFVFAMGGHSASAGHGNHFTQSYTLQVQWILEAVFARLGVKHQSRNFGNGGLGTLHNGIAAGSIYGPDVDVLMWDSGMTEGEAEALDVFGRQGLLGGLKVPVLWSLPPHIAVPLNLKADVDVGYCGSARSGIPLAETVEEIQNMAWAAQYVSCSAELHGICRANEYNGTCWIERDDFTPLTTQQPAPGGRAGWHPGNRIHQVTGRVLAFTFLQALKEALAMWNEAGGYELADDVWHVTAYYENTRSKLAAMKPEESPCNKYEERAELGFLCNQPMKARTEFTPRAYPSLSNIRTLMPPEMVAAIPPPAKNIYDAPDVFNPTLHPPPGEIDVLNIVEAGVDFKSTLNPDYTFFYKKPTFAKPPSVPIGKGIKLSTQTGDDFCDGSVDSFCNRGATSKCLLYGHNDGRNGHLFCGYSGWIVMNVPDVKNGYIVVKIECWHAPTEAIPQIQGWTSINNETRRLESESTNRTSIDRNNWNSTSDQRNLKYVPKEYCAEFRFEYAIDGKVTSLNLDQFNEKRKQVQRVVETFVLLKDPNYTGGQEKEVEVAIRITGCGHDKVLNLNHVYWS